VSVSSSPSTRFFCSRVCLVVMYETCTTKRTFTNRKRHKCSSHLFVQVFVVIYKCYYFLVETNKAILQHTGVTLKVTFVLGHNVIEIGLFLWLTHTGIFNFCTLCRVHRLLLICTEIDWYLSVQLQYIPKNVQTSREQSPYSCQLCQNWVPSIFTRCDRVAPGPGTTKLLHLLLLLPLLPFSEFWSFWPQFFQIISYFQNHKPNFQKMLMNKKFLTFQNKLLRFLKLN
jgi:hypothetical protein